MHKCKRADGQWLWQPWDREAGTEADPGWEKSVAAAPTSDPAGQGDRGKELPMEGH